MVRADWDKASEDILLSGLKEAVTQAKTGDNNFQPEVYSKLAAKLLGMGYAWASGCDVVKSRWTRFKSERNIVHHLRGLSGFGWDEAKGLVTATEAVWKGVLFDSEGRKVKKYSDYNRFRTKAFPEYDTITELMGGNQASGEFAFSSASGAAAAPVPSAVSGPNNGQPDTGLNVNDPLSADSGAASQQETPVVTRTGSASTVNTEEDTATPVAGPPLSSASTAAKRAGSPIPSTPISKRVRVSQTATSLGDLCSSVKQLVQGMVGDGDGAVGTSLSPLRKKAWEQVREKEGLSPYSLARARRVFRTEESVKEYLSFGDDEAEARAFWLHDEMDHANKRN